MSKRFPARFDSECEVCYDIILEGDEIGYNENDEIACSFCLYEEEAEAAEGVEGWKNFFGGGK